MRLATLTAMRSLAALYVDAGYLLHAAATRVAGTSLRSSVKVDYAGLVEGLADQAAEMSGLPVLRTNWYDSGAGVRSAPDAVQTSIGMLPRTKLRLGRLSPNGDQKGVDVRMGLDLVTHARNNAVDVMYLLSGDDDLTEAVEEAQSHGVQVSLLAVPDRDGHAFGVSLHLRQEADGLELITPEVIDSHVTVAGPQGASHAAGQGSDTTGGREAGPDTANGAPATPPTPASVRRPDEPTVPRQPLAPSPADEAPVPASPETATSVPTAPEPIPVPTPRVLATRALRPEPVYRTATGQAPVNHLAEVDIEEMTETIDGVVRQTLGAWQLTNTPTEVRQLLQDRPNIPQALDRALLNDLSTALGIYELDEPTRFLLRRRFWELAQIQLG